MTTLGMKDAWVQRIGSAVAEHYGALRGHLMATEGTAVEVFMNKDMGGMGC